MAKGKARAKRASQGKTAEGAGRVGLAARGVMYCVAAMLAVRLVTGADERVDKEGALDALARQRTGSLLLAILALGFACYSAWRFLRVVTGPKDKESDSIPSRLFKRAADAARGVLYLTLLLTTLRVLFAGRDQVGGAEQGRDLTVSLLRESWGRPVVMVLGGLLLIGGLAVAGRGLQRDFTKTLDRGRVPKWARRLLPVVGAVGYVARGAVLALVGWFVAGAALHFDAGEAVGVAGALGNLSDDLRGRFALSAIAFGLFSFGVFSFVESRYRKVLEK